MQLHNIQPKTSLKGKKRVGRGGKRGTYSGRGIKGQKAHSSGHIRPEMRDTIKKIPKKRGYGKNRSRSVSDAYSKLTPVNISALDKAFRAGEEVTKNTLVLRGVLNRRRGLPPAVKILGNGTLSKALVVSGMSVSKSAKESIERAGGSVS